MRDSVSDSLRPDRCRVGDFPTSSETRAGVVAPAAASSWPDVPRPLVATPVHDLAADTSGSFRCATAVAEFGLLLRDAQYKGDADYDFAYERAREALDNVDDSRRDWRRTVTTGVRPAKDGCGTCLRSMEALGVSLTLSSRMTKGVRGLVSHRRKACVT